MKKKLIFKRGMTRLWNYVELFGNSLDTLSSIVFYLEMKVEVEVEVGVHDDRSRFTPRF